MAKAKVKPVKTVKPVVKDEAQVVDPRADTTKEIKAMNDETATEVPKEVETPKVRQSLNAISNQAPEIKPVVEDKTPIDTDAIDKVVYEVMKKHYMGNKAVGVKAICNQLRKMLN